MRTLLRLLLFSAATCLALVVTRPVEAIPVGPALNDIVFGAIDSMLIEQGTVIDSGATVVNEACDGEMLAGDVELQIGQSVTTPAGYGVFANRIRIRSGANIGGDVCYNELENNGTIEGGLTTPCPLPVIADWPEAPAATPGTDDVVIARGTTDELAPGAYGTLTVRRDATLVFTGGEYDLAEFRGGERCTYLFRGETVLRIAGKFDTDENSYFGPDPEYDLDAADIVVYVHGINGSNGNLGATPKAAQIGRSNTIAANFLVPNGTLWIRQDSTVSGAYLALHLHVGLNVNASLDSAFPVGLAPGRLIARLVIQDPTASIGLILTDSTDTQLIIHINSSQAAPYTEAFIDTIQPAGNYNLRCEYGHGPGGGEGDIPYQLTFETADGVQMRSGTLRYVVNNRDTYPVVIP